jgi:hypothetical protein
MDVLKALLSLFATIAGIIFPKQPTPVTTPTPTPMIQPTPTLSPKPSSRIIKTPNPVRQPADQTPIISSSASIESWVYPNSSVATYESNHLVLTSSDSTDTITNWYEQKIKNQNLNIKTFVRTTANDVVSNKLVGASGENEVRVEIGKSGGNPVKIEVFR